jgi:hypothetical protein
MVVRRIDEAETIAFGLVSERGLVPLRILVCLAESEFQMQTVIKR